MLQDPSTVIGRDCVIMVTDKLVLSPLLLSNILPKILVFGSMLCTKKA